MTISFQGHPPARASREVSAVQNTASRPETQANSQEELGQAVRSGGTRIRYSWGSPRQTHIQANLLAQMGLLRQRADAAAQLHSGASPIPELPFDVFSGQNDSTGIFSYLSRKDQKNFSEVNRSAYYLSRDSTGPTPSLTVTNRAEFLKALEIMKSREAEGRGIAGINVKGYKYMMDKDLLVVGSLLGSVDIQLNHSIAAARATKDANREASLS